MPAANVKQQQLKISEILKKILINLIMYLLVPWLASEYNILYFRKPFTFILVGFLKDGKLSAKSHTDKDSSSPICHMHGSLL